MLTALRELVVLLDQRVPHVERLGEIRIAREAAALRSDAVQRIEQLTAADSDRGTSEGDSPGAAVTDDGGPLPQNDT